MLLVAYELQQNRLATEAQTRADISYMVFEGLQAWADNPTLMQALEKEENGEALTYKEMLILTYSQAGEMRRWENTYYQYERGLFSEAEFVGMQKQWRSRINSSAFQSYWNEERMTFYSEGFAKLIRSLINE